jgi:hypothetical protein
MSLSLHTAPAFSDDDVYYLFGVYCFGGASAAGVKPP